MFPKLSTLDRNLTVLLILEAIILLLMSSWSTNNVDTLHRFSKLPDMSSSYIVKLDSSTKNRPVAKKDVNVSSQAKTISLGRESFQEANPHPFEYILNPKDLCKGQHIYMIIYVHTAPDNFEKRHNIRQTWGRPKILSHFNLQLVFILGQVEDKIVMGKVRRESRRYHDIVQETFMDTYRNLTYKGVAALKWISNFCPNAVYVLKTDDDMMVNIFQLMYVMTDMVEKLHGKTDLVLCHLWSRMRVLRDKKSTWYVSPKEFPLDYYPPYCSGSAYIFSMDVVKRMNAVASSVPFFWVDDYHITGRLVALLGVKQKRLNSAYEIDGKKVLDRLKRDRHHKLLFFHVSKSNTETMFKMWEIIIERMTIILDDSKQDTQS